MLAAASIGLGYMAGTWHAQPAVTQLTEVGGTYHPSVNPVFKGEPLARQPIRRFDMYLMFQAAFDTPQQKLGNVLQWLEPNFVYETVGFPGAKSAADWCLSGEEQHFRTTFNMSEFTQMLFFGTDTKATTTSYGTVYWAAPLRGIPASKKWTEFRVTDFYLARVGDDDQARLYYNFMMIDFADLLRRNGIQVLPPAALPEGHFRPPAAEDGVPAPISVLVAGRDSVEPERICRSILEEDWVGTGQGVAWADDVTFYGPGGIGMAKSRAELLEHVLSPFKEAFDERSVDPQIFLCEANYCGAFGHLHGRHVGSWLGLEASGKKIALRFAFHWRVVDGRVVEGWALFDIPGLFEQLDLDFWATAKRVAETGMQS